MGAAENKHLLQHVYGEAAKGDLQPFLDALADDIEWTIIGSTRFSRTYRGKQAVLDELLHPLVAQLAGPVTLTAHRIIAEGDYVVAEHRGHATTKAGVPYNNTYCNVYRVVDGKIRQLTEYLDTELVTTAFGR